MKHLLDALGHFQVSFQIPEHKIKVNFNVLDEQINEYKELSKKLLAEDSNQNLFHIHPEIFFSTEKLKQLNILKLIFKETNKYKRMDKAKVKY